MNTIDFIRETAAYMAEDRPDVYDHETAVEEISTAVDALREGGESQFECCTFTSYFLARIYDDGVEEFIFSRKVSGLLICEEEEDVRAFSYDESVGLPHIMDTPLDEDDGL